MNPYVKVLGKLFARTPKTVLAAVAVSCLTSGGDRLDEAQSRLLREWRILFENGIVPQKPPRGSSLPDDSQSFLEE